MFLFIFVGSFAFAVFCLFIRNFSSSDNIKFEQRTNKVQNKMTKNGLLAMQADYQFMKLRDPKTGKIPVGIRSRELSFVSTLPVHSEDRSQSWIWRALPT